jgi:hypothetical protein
MRVLPKLGQEIVGQIEGAWKLPQEDWARKRLLVVRLIALHEHTVAEIMKIAAVCRQTVFTYRDKVLAERGERSRPRMGLARSSPGAGQCGFLLGCDKTHPTKTHT